MAKYPRLAEPFAFYASYHHNRINKRIHQVFVPVLVITAMMMLMQIPVPFLSYLTDVFPPNLTSILAVFYCVYYLYLSIGFGILGSVMIMAFLVLADYFYTFTPFSIALGVHVFAWLAQFYGHAFHEHRRPALLENLVQSLLLAPLFVMIETFVEIGFCKEFMVEVNPLIKRKIAHFSTSTTPRSD